MKIGTDHWLEGVQRQLIPGGTEMRVRRFLVIHHTAGASGQSSIDFWRSPEAKGACAHFVIERNGDIIQCRPCDTTCGHAGVSKWQGYTGLNSCSIGIELANAGYDTPGRDAFDWALKQPNFSHARARHKHGGASVSWENYPNAQVVACEALAKALVARYHLDDVVGHDDIAPKRKVDPGPLFEPHMILIRRACGIDRPLPL